MIEFSLTQRRTVGVTLRRLFVYPKDVPIPPGEEWYYEIDGRTHGPLSWTDLEELLDRSGETAAEVRVRRGADGLWSPFRSPPPPTATTLSVALMTDPGSPSASAVAQPAVWRSVSPREASGLRSLFRHHRDIGAAIGAWILLNALFLFLWPQSHARERGYLNTLRAIATEAQVLRAKPASDAEWHQFAERTRVALDPIVSDLKKSASASEPGRQQLLWSARDLVPRTLGPRTRERDELEQKVKQYLDTAERELDSR